MKLKHFVALLVVLQLHQVAAGTLEDVLARGYLKCGVQAGHAGFASPDLYGDWRGFDTDFCRALGAAVLGDAQQVMFVSADRSAGIDSLASGSVDVVARVPFGLGAMGGEGARHVGVLLHDSYGFLVPVAKKTLADLSSQKVCIPAVNGAPAVIIPHLRKTRPDLIALPVPALSQARKRYEKGECQAIGGLRSDLAGIRARLTPPEAHHLLADEIGKAPAGPRVRGGDRQWSKVVQWVLFALIEAEELDLNQGNVEAERETSARVRIKDLLGNGTSLGAMLGIRNDWALQAVRQVGNYREIYARNIGMETKLKLPRTRSKLRTDGGMLFAPPVVAR